MEIPFMVGAELDFLGELSLHSIRENPTHLPVGERMGMRLWPLETMMV